MEAALHSCCFQALPHSFVRSTLFPRRWTRQLTAATAAAPPSTTEVRAWGLVAARMAAPLLPGHQHVAAVQSRAAPSRVCRLRLCNRVPGHCVAVSQNKRHSYRHSATACRLPNPPCRRRVRGHRLPVAEERGHREHFLHHPHPRHRAREWHRSAASQPLPHATGPGAANNRSTIPSRLAPPQQARAHVAMRRACLPVFTRYSLPYRAVHQRLRAARSLHRLPGHGH